MWTVFFTSCMEVMDQFLYHHCYMRCRASQGHGLCVLKGKLSEFLQHRLCAMAGGLMMPIQRDMIHVPSSNISHMRFSGMHPLDNGELIVGEHELSPVAL
jgi:hypothetical protein